MIKNGACQAKNINYNPVYENIYEYNIILMNNFYQKTNIFLK